MKKAAVWFLAMVLLPLFVAAQKHALINARDGSGIFGYKDTPVQPWSGYHVHDPDRPAPKRVEVEEGRPPSDAIVLFDGRDLSRWLPSDWKLGDGWMEAVTTSLTTREEFGDCQLHLEWQAPDPPLGDLMNRGNNGVGFFGGVEIQIFDFYDVKIYPDGQAAAVYAQTPPLVNACRRPGEWQTYDIVMLAPVIQAGGSLKPARVTMFHNGVLVHHNQEIYGASVHAGLPKPLAAGAGPISLLAHHNPVRFRNIWVRRL
jgi:hypothetical protein